MRLIDVEDVFTTQGAVAELTELAECNVPSLYQRKYPSMALVLIDSGCELSLRSETSS